MRGTPHLCYDAAFGLGIIPAYAGNTCQSPCQNTSGRDHPRVCGEHYDEADLAVVLQGSSPRMRGTPPSFHALTRYQGIIPAYAGNTRRGSDVRFPDGDHPRVCGEHSCALVSMGSGAGSSPRMRGTHEVMADRRATSRIIPAYAGNTCDFDWFSGVFEDHPRVCGEHAASKIGDAAASGSSPRMRGTHIYIQLFQCSIGIIPAYAGNTRALELSLRLRRDHPRVCGEHSNVLLMRSNCSGSSPRMRGTLSHSPHSRRRTGIIPAYAGNTLRDYSNFVVSKFMSFVFHLV